MYWGLDGLSYSRFDDIQATRAPAAKIIARTAAMASDAKQCRQAGLNIISVQLTQQRIGSKERTKFRRVDVIEKRGQRRALGKAMRSRDPLGPRGSMDHAEGAAIEE